MPIIVTLSIARKRSGWTQEELAENSDRSQQLIGKLEQQKSQGISFETLINLCNVTRSRTIENAIAYLPEDVSEWDERIPKLAARIHCKAEDIFALFPPELVAEYRRWKRSLR